MADNVSEHDVLCRAEVIVDDGSSSIHFVK
jgi:hypothetical protein